MCVCKTKTGGVEIKFCVSKNQENETNQPITKPTKELSDT